MKKKRNEIVVAATDFGFEAKFGIEHAIGVAKMFGFKVYLLAIIGKKSKFSKEEAVEKLENIKKDIIAKHNLTVEYFIKEGNQTEEIGNFVKEVNAHYLVMGTRGKAGIEYIYGHQAAKIAEGSSAPTMFVQRRKYDIGYKNIVLPIDETPETLQKVKWAILFAKRWNANIHIWVKCATDKYYINKIKTHLMQVKRVFDQNRIFYSIQLSQDKKTNIARQIVEHAISVKGDLIIVMNDPELHAGGIFSGGMFNQSDDIIQMIEDASKILWMIINAEDLKERKPIWGSWFSAGGG